MKPTICIMGSNSFSGAHFVNHCLDEGFPVIGISRSCEYNPVFLPYSKNSHLSGFKFFALDINNDLESIMSVMDEHKPSYVVNFIAQGMVGQSWNRPGDWLKTNTLSTILFHEELRKRQYLEKYVHVSTPEVYGSCSGLVKENTTYRPSTPYAVSKAAADMSLLAYFNAYGFPVVFTRSANVYGPCQQLYRIIPITVLKFMSGQKLQLHGGGLSERSFIHISDVCRGTLDAALNAAPPEIFHFSTGRIITIRNLVELIADMMHISFNDNVEVTEDRLGKDNAYLLDTSKARTVLGWSDKIALENGIEETISWVRDNYSVLKNLSWQYLHKV